MSWREGREYFPSRNDVERRVPERRPNHPHYSLFMLLPSGLSLDVVSSLTVHFVWDVHTIPFFFPSLSVCCPSYSFSLIILCALLHPHYSSYSLLFFIFRFDDNVDTRSDRDTCRDANEFSVFLFSLILFYFFQAPPFFFRACYTSKR